MSLATLKMSSEDEAATYAATNNVSSKAFEMDVNKCYSNISSTSPKSKSDGKEKSSNGVRYFIVGSVLLLVVILVLAATSACVIYALVEIAKLKSRVEDGSCLCSSRMSSLLSVITLQSCQG